MHSLGGLNLPNWRVNVTIFVLLRLHALLRVRLLRVYVVMVLCA